MPQVDARNARLRSGLTQEEWAQVVLLSVARVHALEYRPGQSPGWDAACRMAHYGGFLRVDGPYGPMALAPLHLVVHPEAQEIVVLEQAVEGQTRMFGTPVLVHTTLPAAKSVIPSGLRQLTLGGGRDEA